MNTHSAEIIIPAPSTLKKTEGKLALNRLTTFFVHENFLNLKSDLEKLFATLQMDVKAVSGNADIVLTFDESMVNGAWRMSITPDGISAAAGDKTGASYAVYALMQILFGTEIKGLM